MTLLLLLQWQSRKTLIYCVLIHWYSDDCDDCLSFPLIQFTPELRVELTMGDTGAGVMTNKVSIRSWEPEHHRHHWQSHRIRRKNLICFTSDPVTEEKFNIQFLFLIRQWWRGEGCAWLNINFVHVSTVCWTLDFHLSGGSDDNQGLAANETPPVPELH